MGYGIMPFAVDLTAVRAAFGSKDQTLLAAVIADQDVPDDDTDEDDLEETDDEDESDEDPVVPSSQDALRHIIMGEPFARGVPSKYAYLFKTLCEHLGEMLPNDEWGGTRSEFVEAFDGVLEKLKVPADVFRMQTHLVGRRDPVPLPPRQDFPSVGFLTRDEAAAAHRALSALAPAAVLAAAAGIRVRRAAVEPEFVAAGLAEIVDWCRACVAEGKDLVTFYH